MIRLTKRIVDLYNLFNIIYKSNIFDVHIITILYCYYIDNTNICLSVSSTKSGLYVQNQRPERPSARRPWKYPTLRAQHGPV